jgi:RNA polymerase sigma-70 factor (ECF subfamily)
VELDATTLGDLFEDEGRALLRYATRRTFDPDLALDLVGETFAVAFERRRSFRGSTRAEAVGWLFAICRTVIHHHFRRGDAERRALPDEQRRALELRVVEERSYEEVAEQLGVTQETARARVSRGLRALGQGMRLEGVGDAC